MHRTADQSKAMTSITIKEYLAVEGSPFSNDDAKKIGPVLAELSERGAVTARDIVDAARSTNSPLHDYFEWNDKRAADQYRLEEARKMLRSITIRYIEDGQPKTARAFQVMTKSAYEAGPRNYQTFEVLHGDTAFAASMMDRASEELMTWRKRYAPYTEMWTKFGDCFQQVLNQISEFEEEFGTQNLAPGTDAALKRLLAWRDECKAVMETWTEAREQVGYLMEAIDETEKTFGQVGPQRRKCMKCQEGFLSMHSGHRLCARCRKSTEGLEAREIKIA